MDYEEGQTLTVLNYQFPLVKNGTKNLHLDFNEIV